MLTQRIAKNASALLLGDAIDAESAFLLGKDTNTFRDTIQALAGAVTRCASPPTTDPDTKQKLAELEASSGEYRTAVGGILGNMQRLTIAKQAGSQIFS
jgi:twitching motility protein PilJ